MRLEGQSKLGYYATPGLSLKLILTWLCLSLEVGLRRYLDPCCGLGEALAAIAAAQGPTETFGIELSDVRAQAAERTLDHVLNTAYEYAVLVNESFSLVLLNPPYDGENATGSGRRMEETFLLDTTPRLTPGGILIYLIPYHRLNDKIARHLAGWYSDLRCFKLAGEDHAAFDQIVVFGVRRATYTPAGGDDLRIVQAWADAHSVIGYEPREIEEAQPDGTIKVKKVRAALYGDLPELIEGHGEYAIPVSPLKSKGGVFRFQYHPVSDDDYLREADGAAIGLENSRAWRDLIPPVAPPTIRPVMSPKRGHIATQVNGGLLGTNLVRSPDQSPLLIKGNIRKSTSVQRNDPLADAVQVSGDDDREHLQKVEVRQHFETVLTTLDAQGNFVTATEAQQIKDLLDRYVEQLATIVEARNAPQYDLRPEPWEWAVFDPLSKDRHLPGRAETGLTTFQKHLAIALGRLLLASGVGVVNTEMGGGKSTIALAVAEYLRIAQERRGQISRAFPALIVGPGMVTGEENWPKEIAGVISGAASRIITIGAKPLPKAVKIGEWVRSLFVSNPRPQTNDERRLYRFEMKAIEAAVHDEQFESLAPADFLQQLQKMVKSITDPAIKQRVGERLRQALVPLRATLKQADQHPPRRRPKRKASNLMDARLGGYLWLGLDVPRDPEQAREIAAKYSVLQFMADYRRGALPPKSLAILSFETAKLGSGRIPAMTTRLLRVRYLDDRNRRRVRTERVCACPTCGAIVAAEDYDETDGHALEPLYPGQAEEWVGLRRRYCQSPHPRRVWDAEKNKHIERHSDDNGVLYVCGAPLFEESDLRRMPAATMVKRARGFFGLLVIDEAHKAKAKGTGVGWVLTVLNGVCRFTLGATGTLFGGFSTSIFWLMYRLSSDVRRQFAYSDDRRWVDRYGLLKTTFYVPDAKEVAEDGAYTGTREYLSVSELPGISPAIARVSLPYCTFSSLKDDPDLPLPEYEEHIVRLALTDAMAEQMKEADGQAELAGLFKWALARNREKDGHGAISVWLNTALNRLDAMYRGEQVIFHPRVSGRGRFTVRREESVLTLPPIFTTSVVADKSTGRPVVVDNATGRVIDAEPEWLPKEKWAAHQCLLERDEDRKTLIFVRQTGERDIQPRLALALQAVGLRVGVLRPSLAPRLRGAWLKNHANEFDVLLSNARLIEVGLNLTMFNTEIFIESEWSLYVLWQALRRLYRPGAPKKVKAFFPVYSGTQEENLIDLMGHKMLSAQTFYGDDVGGALVEEVDDGDLLGDLVRKALGQLQIGRAEGLFTLGNQPSVTQSPLGSLTAVSPALHTLAELMARRNELLPRRLPSRRVLVSSSQLTLF